MTEHREAGEFEVRSAADYAGWVGHVVRLRTRSDLPGVPDVINVARLIAIVDTGKSWVFTLDGRGLVSGYTVAPSSDGSPVQSTVTIQRVRTMDPW